jgi:hypothetical protein
MPLRGSSGIAYPLFPRLSARNVTIFFLWFKKINRTVATVPAIDVLPAACRNHTHAKGQDHEEGRDEGDADDPVDEDPGEARQCRRPGGNEDRETQITGNPFSATEAMEAGETVPRDKGESDPGNKGKGEEAEGQGCQGESPPNIEDQDDRRPSPPRLAIDVRRSRVPAELRAGVLLAQQAQDHDGKVDRACKIGQKKEPGKAHLHPLPHPRGRLETAAGDVPHL